MTTCKNCDNYNIELDLDAMLEDANKAYDEGYNMAEQHKIQQLAVFAKVLRSVVGKLGAAGMRQDEEIDKITKLLDRSTKEIIRLRAQHKKESWLPNNP